MLLLLFHFGPIGVKLSGVVIVACGPFRILSSGCRVGVARFTLCELFRDICADSVKDK